MGKENSLLKSSIFSTICEETSDHLITIPNALKSVQCMTGDFIPTSIFLFREAVQCITGDLIPTIRLPRRAESVLEQPEFNGSNIGLLSMITHNP